MGSEFVKHIEHAGTELYPSVTCDYVLVTICEWWLGYCLIDGWRICSFDCDLMMMIMRGGRCPPPTDCNLRNGRVFPCSDVRLKKQGKLLILHWMRIHHNLQSNPCHVLRHYKTWRNIDNQRVLEFVIAGFSCEKKIASQADCMYVRRAWIWRSLSQEN